MLHAVGKIENGFQKRRENKLLMSSFGEVQIKGVTIIFGHLRVTNLIALLSKNLTHTNKNAKKIQKANS